VLEWPAISDSNGTATRLCEGDVMTFVGVHELRHVFGWRFHRSIMSVSGVTRANGPGWLLKVRGNVSLAVPISRNAI
jgi:hypothetical protein